MLDVIFVALMLLLALLTWAFVVGCDKLIGPDDVALHDRVREDAGEGAPSRRRVA